MTSRFVVSIYYILLPSYMFFHGDDVYLRWVFKLFGERQKTFWAAVSKTCCTLKRLCVVWQLSPLSSFLFFWLLRHLEMFPSCVFTFLFFAKPAVQTIYKEHDSKIWPMNVLVKSSGSGGTDDVSGATGLKVFCIFHAKCLFIASCEDANGEMELLTSNKARTRNQWWVIFTVNIHMSTFSKIVFTYNWKGTRRNLGKLFG